MKNHNTIQFILQRPVKDIKANLIQTMNMCNAMAKNNQDIELLMLNTLEKEKAINLFKTIISDYNKYFKIKLVSYSPIFPFFNELNRFLGLKKHINFSCDYIFTRSPLIAIYTVLKKQNTIYEAHNSYFAKNNILNYLYKQIFIKILKKDSFKLFISISGNLNKYWMENGINLNKTIGLHDGTSIHTTVNKEEIEIPFKNGKPLITYTGSLYKDRGIDRIIQLSKDFSNLNFLIIGGPKETAILLQEECERLKLNNIVFTGPVAHRKVALYLNQSDVLLALWSKKVPTINYCSPLKVFEYMASNKLIIADGFVTIKEVLTNEENALLIEPDNYNSLKEALTKVINNKEHYYNLGKNNSKLIETKYSWENRSKLILNKLNEISK